MKWSEYKIPTIAAVFDTDIVKIRGLYYILKSIGVRKYAIRYFGWSEILKIIVREFNIGAAKIASELDI